LQQSQSILLIIKNLNGENIMYHQHYLEAIETVLDWDLPEEAFADAINQQFAFITNRTGDDNDQDSSLQ
jgi:hypothetical protein